MENKSLSLRQEITDQSHFGVVREAPPFIVWQWAGPSKGWQGISGSSTRREGLLIARDLGGGVVLPSGTHPTDVDEEMLRRVG
ncbi:MAG: hypothetical protein FJ271_21050 [Planctomycetes bacterium]|nr:hypothetical protein [Planctomycetota bacterium]